MKNLSQNELKEISGGWGNIGILAEAFAKHVDDTYFGGAIGDFLTGEE